MRRVIDELRINMVMMTILPTIITNFGAGHGVFPSKEMDMLKYSNQTYHLKT